MISHRLLVVVVGILGINISPTLAELTYLNLTITPGHAHIRHGTDLDVLCKADVPITNCQFRVKDGRVYDLSEGYLTAPDEEFSYFGEGLENGDCGATIRGHGRDIGVYIVACRAKSRSSDWAFAEMALITHRQDGLDVTITPSRTVTVLPGNPIRVVADAKKPLSQCSLVLTSDIGNSNERRRFNFYQNTTADSKNPVGTGMEYYGKGVNEGQCGIQVLKAKEEFNNGAWIDLFYSDDHLETVFFRFIVARAPGKPTLTYNATENVGGSVDFSATCSVESRPAATLSWYLGGERIPDTFVNVTPTTDWRWPSNFQTVEQNVRFRLNATDAGKEVWCLAEHIALDRPKESDRVNTSVSHLPNVNILIAGGKDVDMSNFPYQLLWQQDSTRYCGASIISETWAVTAAHCVIYSVRTMLLASFLRAGSSDRTQGGVVKKLSQIIPHELYNSSTLDYDIALLKMRTPLVYSSVIKNIALPAATTVLDVIYAGVSGWGATSSGDIGYPTKLSAVIVPVVSQASCIASYGAIGTITDRMICAGREGKGTCQGDSGGPMMAVLSGTRTLIGITSTGQGCGDTVYPDVYARVTTLRRWIEDNSGV